MTTTLTQLLGTRFGTIEYADEDIVTFNDGLIGFPALRAFVLLSHKPDSPFRWLQSLDEPALAFLLVDPASYVSDYDPHISTSEARNLNLTEDTPRMMLTTAAIPGGKVDNMTVNLAAPIVINLEARVGKQVVLEGDRYSIRHHAFTQAKAA
jgi:flagellar assembly factor FliW